MGSKSIIMEEIYDIYGNWIARCSIMGLSNPRLANGTYSSDIEWSHACVDAAAMAWVFSVALVDYLAPQPPTTFRTITLNPQ